MLTACAAFYSSLSHSPVRDSSLLKPLRHPLKQRNFCAHSTLTPPNKKGSPPWPSWKRQPHLMLNRFQEAFRIPRQPFAQRWFALALRWLAQITSWNCGFLPFPMTTLPSFKNSCSIAFLLFPVRRPRKRFKKSKRPWQNRRIPNLEKRRQPPNRSCLTTPSP